MDSAQTDTVSDRGHEGGEGQFNRNAPKCEESEPGHILSSERQRLHIRSPTAEWKDEILKQDSDEAQ